MATAMVIVMAISISALYIDFKELLDSGTTLKLDNGELRRLFLHAGSIAVASSILVVVFASSIFFRLSQPYMQKIEQQAESFNTIANAAHESIFLIDTNGRICYANSSASRLFGYTIKEMIGESIKIGAYEVIKAPRAFAYIHQGIRLATVLGLNMSEGVDQVGHELTMQVAAMAPVAVDKDDVEQSVIDKEMEIGMDQARQEGKPEEMLEKIAMGKVNKFLKENTLLNQVFVRDGKKSVRDYLKETNAELSVTGFKRLMLGA